MTSTSENVGQTGTENSKIRSTYCPFRAFSMAVTTGLSRPLSEVVQATAA